MNYKNEKASKEFERIADDLSKFPFWSVKYSLTLSCFKYSALLKN
jgi:hypothetical protein